MRKTVLFEITKSFCARYRINEDYAGKIVVIYQDRYSHIEKHKGEFYSVESYQQSVDSLADIIANPEFISFNTKNASLEFVKFISENTLVAVTISTSEELKVKTMYPISLEKYLKLKNSR